MPLLLCHTQYTKLHVRPALLLCTVGNRIRKLRPDGICGTVHRAKRPDTAARVWAVQSTLWTRRNNPANAQPTRPSYEQPYRGRERGESNSGSSNVLRLADQAPFKHKWFLFLKWSLCNTSAESGVSCGEGASSPTALEPRTGDFAMVHLLS